MKTPVLDGSGEGEGSARVSKEAGRKWFRKYATVLALVALCVLFAILKPSVFVSVHNFRNILVAVAVAGVFAVSQTVVMTLGDFDLSIGACAEMVGIIVAVLMVRNHLSPPVAVLIGLAIGGVAGLLNGTLTAYLNISAFIATLSTGIIFGGVAFIYNHGATVFSIPKSFIRIGQGSFGPVPVAVVITVVLCLILYFVMARSTVGRWWYATGGNYEASYLAGLRVRRLRLLAYVVCAMGGALGGIMLTSRLASANPLQGDPFTLTSITAVFLGMTAFKEGQPNIAGTVVGVLFLGVLTNGLNLTHVNTYDQAVITGAVTLVAVALSGAAKKRRT